MWVRIDLPFICERMIAFSIPDDGEMWVLSYEGLHRIKLSPVVSVETFRQHAEDYTIYDHKRCELTFGECRYPMVGLHGGKPILEHPNGDQLKPDEERVTILDEQGDEKQVMEIVDLSGDWGHATFSRDGRQLVIGVPYRLFVYQNIDI